MNVMIDKGLPRNQRRVLLAAEAKRRKSGDWGEWETLTFPMGSVGGSGWTYFITTVHRNKVFSVLDRRAELGVRHLAVSSLSGERPTWHEMQRIKDDLAGPDATAIEVYPPHEHIVDGADMFHIWVLKGSLPFGLHVQPKTAAMAALRSA